MAHLTYLTHLTCGAQPQVVATARTRTLLAALAAGFERARVRASLHPMAQQAPHRLENTQASRGDQQASLPTAATLVALGAIVVGFLGLAVCAPYARHPVAFYCFVSLIFAALVALTRRPARLVWSWVLAVALLARLALFFAPADLSDDLYRYVWDGRVVLAGHDPYLTTPNDPTLASLRDENWELTAHRDVPTVYPPLAQAFFAAAAATSRPLSTFKLFVLLLDLFGCVALWHCAVLIGTDPTRTIWYAWNPLVVLEGAAMGHVDLLGLPFAILALLLLLRTRRGAAEIWSAGCAGAAAAAAILIKLVPLVAIPAYVVLCAGRRARIAFLTTLLAGAGGALGALLASAGLPPGLLRYGISWEFNGPLFEPLWRALRLLKVDDWLKSEIPTLERWFSLDLGGLYSYLYPQLIAKVLLVVLLAATLLYGAWIWFQRRSCDRAPLQFLHLCFGGALLCSATLYPWYLVWALPTAVLLSSVPWLVLSASILFAYLPRLFGVEYFPFTYVAVWLPFLLAILWRLRSDSAAPAQQPTTAPHATNRSTRPASRGSIQ